MEIKKHIIYFGPEYLFCDETGYIGEFHVESDIFYHFCSSFISLGYEVTTAPFVTENNNMRLSQEVFNMLQHGKFDYAFFDVNFLFGHAFPEWILKIKAYLPYTYAFVPDCYLKNNIFEILKSWAPIIDMFLTIEPASVPVLEKYFNIKLITSIPIVKIDQPTKPIDFSYIGSPKSHRTKLLSRIVSSTYNYHISTSGRISGVCPRTVDYMKILAQSKCSLVTPALPYNYIYQGTTISEPPIAGRLYECIATGVIPLYYGAYTLYGSRTKKLNSIEKLKRYFKDGTQDNFGCGVSWAKQLLWRVDTEDDILNYVRLIREEGPKIIEWRNRAGEIYEEYISPKSVIRQIEAND